MGRYKKSGQRAAFLLVAMSARVLASDGERIYTWNGQTRLKAAESSANIFL